MEHELMTELSTANVDEFLTRFQNFYDGLVRNVNFSFTRQRDTRPAGVPRGVVIVLSSQDQEATEDEGWANVTLDIEAVSEFVFIEGRTTSVVLSSGLSVGFFDDKVYLSIDWEAESIEEFRESQFLVIGERCFWTASKYGEANE